MSDSQELVCIVCPLGCRLKISGRASGSLSVEGNSCLRGKDYAIAEITQPSRTVPSTVAIRGAFLPRLPVKTERPVPKEAIRRCMEEIKRVTVDAPVRLGDVIVPNIAGTGVALVATRSMSSV